MKINDVKAPSRLQLIIAVARAADRPTRYTVGPLLLQHNRDINPSLIPGVKGRCAVQDSPPRARVARLIPRDTL